MPYPRGLIEHRSGDRQGYIQDSILVTMKQIARVHHDPADMDGLEKFLSHLFRRVVMTISGVGLAMVTSIIYLRVTSVLLLIFGLFVSFVLIALVFLLPNPQRYPFRVRRARRAGRMP